MTIGDRVGVNAVERIVVGDLGWIFREQPILDFGIDAQVELVEDGDPTGKLIGLQIKTGLGNFRETSEGLVYYGEPQSQIKAQNHRQASQRCDGGF